MNTLLTILWIFLPLGVANTAPVLANNIPLLKRFHTPLDLGKSYRGKRIFGDHKTIRGIIAGTLMGGVIAGLQMLLHTQVETLAQYSASLDYGSPVVLLMGASLGFGAVAGDAVKSFFKRQIGIAPGKNWVPFDQLDFVLGGMVASLPFIRLEPYFYLVGIFTALILHPTINVISWLLGLQDEPF